MDTDQIRWVAQLREVPIIFRQAMLGEGEQSIRHRPTARKWSAIEALGHYDRQNYSLVPSRQADHA